MASVTIRFYEELNDFLPPDRRKRQFAAELAPGGTVKAVIEDLGVPHTEVDLVLVNGQSVAFDYRLKDGDLVSVYPMFESWDITGLSRVRATPLRTIRFALDVHLGKLAKLLRMLGFDSAYGNDAEDEELVRAARRDERIILTRDRGLLKRRAVTHGYCVRALAPREQLAEVVRRFDLGGQVRMFTRCMECNTTLEPVEKQQIAHLLPDVVRSLYADFSRCPACNRVFWRGSHWESMSRLVAELFPRQDSPAAGVDKAKS